MEVKDDCVINQNGCKKGNPKKNERHLLSMRKNNNDDLVFVMVAVADSLRLRLIICIINFFIDRKMPKTDSAKDMNVKAVKYSFVAEAKTPKIMKPVRKRRTRTTLP